MKKIYKIGFGVLICVVIVSFSISLYYSNSLNQKINNIYNFQKTSDKPEYHFSIIINESENSFWKQFKKGVDEAVNKYNVAVEFNIVPGVGDNDKALEYLDISVLSNVDGIITQGFQSEKYKEYIDNAEEKGVPVVTVEADVQKSKRTSFVGANSFEIGVSSGQFINDITKGDANIAIIFQGYNKEQVDISSNLILSGLKNTVNQIDTMNIVTIEQSSKGILSAEDIILDIVKKHPEVNLIFCTSAKDTLSAAQVIVDLNKVGNIKILGFDMSPEIEKYIEKGIVLNGTIGRRPKDMGFKCVEALYNIKKGIYSSDFIDTGIDLITTDNLKNFENNENYYSK